MKLKEALQKRNESFEFSDKKERKRSQNIIQLNSDVKQFYATSQEKESAHKKNSVQFVFENEIQTIDLEEVTKKDLESTLEEEFEDLQMASYREGTGIS